MVNKEAIDNPELIEPEAAFKIGKLVASVPDLFTKFEGRIEASDADWCGSR